MRQPKFLPFLIATFAICFAIQPIYAQAVVGPVKPTSEQTTTLSAAVLSEAAPVLGSPTELSLSQFRKYLNATAIQQRDAGELTQQQVRAIKFASLFDRRWLRNAHQAAAEAALSEGAASSYAAIDWSQLIDLLIKILPIILALFGI